MATTNPTARYGPRGFLATLATIAIVETATWAWLPFWFASIFFFVLATVVVVPTGLFMRELPDTASQVGRGILIGYLATPLTIAATVIPATVIYQLLQHLH
ncbi:MULTISPECIES: hypothetical protein [unclassified Mycobacterium]|uniref:hypothetical protein n=1 Tax=unclassified Mycobacterium TaxID=2642494 RepID=UPI00040CFA8E|nr:MULTISPECIES: hypothetical protein [unclassified Mycobacterium]